MKQDVLKQTLDFIEVAPFTGAWIETSHVSDAGKLSEVAPFTGAWIETCIMFIIDGILQKSPLSQGRGLKLISVAYLPHEVSRPFHRGVD